MGYSGAGGKLIHEKTRSKKSRDTIPLSTASYKQKVPYINSKFVSRNLNLFSTKKPTGHHLDVLGRDVKMSYLLDVVAGELENVRRYVLQHGHNVHCHLSKK
jgi:hypothetical protein